jgi:hypothetical protein
VANWISFFTVLIAIQVKRQRHLTAKLAASALLAFVVFTPSGTALAQSFSAPTGYPIADNSNFGVVGDFNGDGKPDLAVASVLTNSVGVLINAGGGTFQNPILYFGTDAWPNFVATADFNKDSKLDLVTANFRGGSLSNGSISVLLGNGNGTFQPRVNYEVSNSILNPHGVCVGDFNNDTNLDVAVGSFNGSSAGVLLGNGNGTFQAAVAYPVGISTAHIVTADFNGDTKLDLALTSTQNGATRILIGNGDGTFASGQLISTGSYSAGIISSDLNGDLKQDLIIAAANSNAVLVLFGNGDATFQTPVFYPAGNGPQELVLSDLNGDGKDDIGCINSNANTFSVFRGNGNGTFQPAVSMPVRSGSFTPLAPDLNADGKPDLVIIDNAVDFVDVRLNSPSASSVAMTAAAGVSSRILAATFLDYDSSKTACNFTATINWGDGTAPASGTVVANGSGGFDVVGNHTYSALGVYLVTVQIADTNGNFESVSSSATVGPANGKLLNGSAGSGQTTPVNNAFTTQLQVAYTESGAPVSGILVTFTAPVCGASGTFSGTASTSESVLTDANGIATASMFTANSIGGSYLVNATVSNGSPATSFSLTNAKLDQTIAFGALSNRTFGDADFSVSATATSGLAVSFAASGNCTVSGSTVHITAAGSCTITASQAGNASYNAAPDAPQSFTIGKSNQTISFGLLSNKTFGDPDFSVSATASSGLAVSFGASGNCTISASTVHITGAGSCMITASQAGNTNYNAAPDVPQGFTIGKANQTITFGALSNKTFGDADFNVSATATSGLAVSFSATGNCTISGNAVHITGAGSCTITASQSGNASYNAAPDVQRSFNIAKAASATAVSSSLSPADFGQSITLTVTVSSAAGTPGGTAQLKDNGANLGAPVSLNAAGIATLVTSSLTPGTHSITADYSGNTNFLAGSGTMAGGQVIRSLPSLTINDASIIEGDSGTKTLNFTVTLSAASSLTVTLNYATANNTATAGPDYVSTSGALTFNPGDLTKTISVTINGDQSFEQNETFFVNLSSPSNASISDNQGLGTINNDDAQGGFVSLSQASYNVSESGGLLTINVNRSNDVTRVATIDYATDDTGAPAACSTSNGLASSRCDFARTTGTLSFAAGEVQKSFSIVVDRDSYTEGSEMFSVSLSNPTGGAVLTGPFSALVTISDDNSGLPANAIDDARNFVRQHYHDFLNREPDASGWDFWASQITSCGSDAQCNEVRRIDVSASFFLSIEFQQSGYLVERFYKVAYGDAQGTSGFNGQHALAVPMVRFSEFLKDTQRIGRGVVVLQPGWEQALESNKQVYALEFVQTARFISAFPTSRTPAQFVDQLNSNAGGNVLSATERTTAINLFGGAGNTSNNTARAQVVRQVAEDTDLYNAEYNRAFVLAQYFGYLRRNPNDAPETTFDYTGYDFWLTKLNQFNGNYINAEMVKAFLSSIEYRQRFGP